MPNGGKKSLVANLVKKLRLHTLITWLNKRLHPVSLPFALLVTSLVFLIGFVAVLAQLLKTEDFMYQQFNRSSQQIETLQTKIDALRQENRDQQFKLDNLNIRVEYYAPNNQ